YDAAGGQLGSNSRGDVLVTVAPGQHAGDQVADLTASGAQEFLDPALREQQQAGMVYQLPADRPVGRVKTEDVFGGVAVPLGVECERTRLPFGHRGEQRIYDRGLELA